MHVVIPAVIALLCVPASALARPTGKLLVRTFDQAGASLPGVRVAN